MNNNFKKELPIILIVALPFIYLGYIWKDLPESVPMHYNIHGEVDRYGNKIELLIIPFLLPLLTYLIMLAFPSLDPNNQAEKMGSKFQNLKFILVSFLSILALYILKTTHDPELMNVSTVYGLVGILFMILGYFFQSIKSNYFIGIRTPWTLKDKNVWHRTHNMAGVLWIIGGLGIAICSFVTEAKTAFIIMMSITAIITLIPIIYSYLEFKKK